MSGFTINGFGGTAPRIDAKQLPQNYAKVANNCKLWNKILRALKQPLLVASPTKAGVLSSMYRLSDGVTDYWLSWVQDVDAIRSPTAGDTTKRLIYSGNYEPRVTNLEMASDKTDTVNGSNIYPGGYGESVATDYPRAFYALGLPAPACPPVLGAPSGGSGTDETRTYVYTFVNAWGEESAPSPASVEQTGKPDGAWPLSQMDAAPLNTGSVLGASHASGIATVYTSGMHWMRKGHRFAIASVSGATELNASFTAYNADNRATTTLSRTRTGTHATLTLRSVAGFEVGQIVTVADVGGSGYDGTRTLTGVDTAQNTITFADATGVEGATADTGGKVTLGWVEVELASMTSYSSGGTWTRQAPYNVGSGRKRVYRSVTGTTGTDYQYVDELAISTTSYSDSKGPSSLGEQLATAGFDMPPGDLQGIIELPGGFSAGFRENEICFSEPYSPYAWPERYRLVSAYPVVGLGVYGSTLVVCTTATPYRAVGFHPEAMAMDTVGEAHPCLSKRSVVSLAVGVAWSSDRGLVMDTAGGPRMITGLHHDRDTWQASVDPDNIIAFEMDNRYHGFWADGDLGHAIVLDYTEELGQLTENTTLVRGVWSDPETGIGYIINDGGIYQWDADTARVLTYEWRSKEFVMPRPTNMGAAHVLADFDVAQENIDAVAAANVSIEAANAAIIAAIPVGAEEEGTLYGGLGELALGELTFGDDILEDMLVAASQELQFTLFADGVLRFSKNLSEDRAFRLPDGYRARTYEVRVTGTVDVQQIAVAETMRELKAV